jgi:hypothetical protein
MTIALFGASMVLYVGEGELEEECVVGGGREWGRMKRARRRSRRSKGREGGELRKRKEEGGERRPQFLPCLAVQSAKF